jgi:hypothetical protein
MCLLMMVFGFMRLSDFIPKFKIQNLKFKIGVHQFFTFYPEVSGQAF